MRINNVDADRVKQTIAVVQADSNQWFPGLHRVFALEGEAPRSATRSSSSS